MSRICSRETPYRTVADALVRGVPEDDEEDEDEQGEDEEESEEDEDQGEGYSE